MKPNSSTIRQFKATKEYESIIEEWAKSSGFRFTKKEDGMIECYRAGWSTTAPVLLRVMKKKTNVKLEVMLKVDFISQMTTLFTAPDELALESGDGPLEYERVIARTFVNKLMTDLQLEPIA